MRKFKITFLLIFCQLILTKVSFSQCASTINHWESCVLDNQNWKIIVPNTALPGWQLPNYNSSSWSIGPGGVGYGDNDDNTLIPSNTVTVYMRRSFNIIDTGAIGSFLLAMDYDDGFVAYLNGVEIARSNIVGVPTYNSLASASHEALLYQNLQPEYFTLNPLAVDTLLKSGMNELCIETHNASVNNTDLTSRPFILLGINTPAVNYLPTPAWYNVMTALYTNLPIMSINTLGQTIMDDPRIVCNMGIIYNGVGQMNCVYDSANNYKGKISIEYRGSSSQMFPKKPYGFSTVNTAGIDSNVSLLGMPIESDWVLDNPYTDKTFMRNPIMYDLAKAMNWYTTRVQFIELVINGDYQGIYVLQEKIKRDDNRVNVAKLTNTMNSGDSLTGGYIFKVDWSTGNSGFQWNTNQGVYMQNHDPNWNQITSSQQNYLVNYINTFESSLFGANASNPTTGYRKYANVYSFADFFILEELSNNLDGYRASNYMHKDRDSRCGRFTIGPFWDFNITLGNANYCNADLTTGWQLNLGCAQGSGSSIWMLQMLQDQWFKNLLNCRYNDLRQGILSTASINARIDSFKNLLQQAHVRDSALWQTIGIYVWPNNFIGNSWQAEIDYLKTWIAGRLSWIDANIYPTTQACNTAANVSLCIDEINFHSDSTRNAGDWIELHNYGQTPIDLSNAMIMDDDRHEKYCIIPFGTTIAPNGRLVIYADSLLFATEHPGVNNKTGPMCFKLNNAGQKLIIKDKDNRLIYSVDFSDTWQWTTDGNGRTLQLLTSTSNPNVTSSWYAGCIGGSPGVSYTACIENPIYTEINYSSLATADAGDWLELFNKDPNNAFNLSGWSLRDASDNNVYVFPANTILQPQTYIALFSDAAKFTSRFPTVTNKLGPIGFGLSSSGDILRLYDNAGKIYYSVSYQTTTPWPTDPNGLGKTLENGQYIGNHNNPSSWFTGCPEGSPGKVYNPICYPLEVSSTSMEDELVSVYPNPAFETLYYSCTKKIAHIKLIDATGHILLEQTTSGNSIDVKNLSTGFYFIEFTLDDNQHYFIKFVKQ